MPVLGYLISTFLLMTALFWILERKKIVVSFGVEHVFTYSSSRNGSTVNSDGFSDLRKHWESSMSSGFQVIFNPNIFSRNWVLGGTLVGVLGSSAGAGPSLPAPSIFRLRPYPPRRDLLRPVWRSTHRSGRIPEGLLVITASMA
jgi:hypothetical protein